MQRHWLIILLLVVSAVAIGSGVGIAQLVRRPVIFTITNITKNGADATEEFADVLGDYRAASIPKTFSGSLGKLAEASVIGRMWENGTHYVIFSHNTGNDTIYLNVNSKEGPFEFETTTDSMDSEVTDITEFKVGSSTIVVTYKPNSNNTVS